MSIRSPDGRGWCGSASPNGHIALAFGADAAYVSPVWPRRPGEQTMMMHFEVAVADVRASVDRAVAAGGGVAAWQPPDRDPSALTVMLDPAGDPLCLFHDPTIETP